MSRAKIEAVNQEQSWSIILAPHSPLATDVELAMTPCPASDCDDIRSLWANIDDYLETPPATASIPPLKAPKPLMDHSHAVVCVRTDRISSNINISGIVIETHGLVLTTAHDLFPDENVVLAVPNGPTHIGRVLELDYAADLALIHSDYQYGQTIAIAGGRNLLERGEHVYAIGCGEVEQINAKSGVVDGPPRRANGQPLWQVAMGIVPGSSGGPVFDAQGTFVAMIKGRHRDVANVGFLIPLETIIHFVRVSLS